MPAGRTSWNVLAALLLSLVLTFASVLLYAFYPLVSALLTSSSDRSGSGGIGAVAGGLAESFLWAALLVEPVLFLVTFALLQRRRAKS